MNTRLFILAGLLALSGAAHADTSHAKTTSLGTSKVRTPGGTNIVKANILAGSSLPAAREIYSSIIGNGIANALQTGYKVALPQQLADQEEIRPWKAGEPRIITAKTGSVISARLTNLMQQSKHLYDKGEITDGQLATVNSLSGWVNAFDAMSQVLAKHRVAVSMEP